MKRTILSLVCLLAVGNASAYVLDFEGVGDYNPVGDYYNGGAGTNYGASFSPSTLAIVSSAAGGSGNFANEPSANTVMFFIDANNSILNVASGFTTGFSFFYTSSLAASVNVYDGLNGTGTLLGSLTLTAQYNNNCSGDYCNWSSVGVSFAGTGKSIDFGGTANQVAFDDITIGSAKAGDNGQVPEPASLALLGLGLAGLAASRRRTKQP